jgi:pyruvate,water dikinase
VKELVAPAEEAKAGAVSVGISPEQLLPLYPVTATKIYMNLGEPDAIERYKDLPFDGIGLMRIEFIISDWVQYHPLYLIEQGKPEVFIDKLAEGIAKVAQAIYPRPVVVRFSDFKTNEYRGLKGGEKYEPEERNPMIGWRGVSRYIHPKYEPAFRLEVRAIKKVREEMGLKNVWVMFPFVRTTCELEKALKIMEEEGLKRGKDFKVCAMAEVPSIVFLADKFAEYVDGFSIGSNDLTQLVLATDRDSQILGEMGYFDERDPAVLLAIKTLIQKAHSKGATVSICGQAPSVYPEIVEFLVENGIDSISVNPDAVIGTRRLVASIERKVMMKKLAKIQEKLDKLELGF